MMLVVCVIYCCSFCIVCVISSCEFGMYVFIYIIIPGKAVVFAVFFEFFQKCVEDE